jgi:hypothetical protein
LKDRARQPGDFFARYVDGDWGEIPPEDIGVTASYLIVMTRFLTGIMPTG